MIAARLVLVAFLIAAALLVLSVAIPTMIAGADGASPPPPKTPGSFAAFGLTPDFRHGHFLPNPRRRPR